MPRRSPYVDDYDYDEDDEYEEKHPVRRHKKEDNEPEKKRRWDRENNYDRGRDHDDRR